MDAEQYAVSHWLRKKTYTHLTNKKHTTRFTECVKHVVGKRFLDVGCACGHSTQIMAGLKTGDWTGLDFSESMIDAAREFFPDSRWLYCPDMDMPLTCIAFDSVVCSEVIEHVPEDEKFVAYLWGLAKKVLVLTTPNKRVRDPGHLRVYTREMIDELLAPFDCDKNIYSKGQFWYIVLTKK